MRTGKTILISGSSNEGGGLFSMIGREISKVDSMTTMGLCVAGDRLARLLKSPDATETLTELLVYDARGIERYYRFDGMGDPHDIYWTGEHYAVVSSIQNRISWISPDGSIAKIWNAPGEADSWHINCLCEHDGELHVSVFGKFATHRGWADEKNGRSGFILRLNDHAQVANGLSQPHTPRFVDGVWVICNSFAHELLAIDPQSGSVTRRLKLLGYTRGIAVSDSYLLVGESAGRYAGDRELSSICAIDRKTWDVLWRVDVPTREIYDIVEVDASLAAGAANGFRTTRFRTLEQDQYALFEQAGVKPVRLWAIGDPLPNEGFNISIEADAPATMRATAAVQVPVRIRNNAGVILVTAPPNPVFICYRWFRVSDGESVGAGEWIHTPLPRSVPPNEWVNATALIAAPEQVGEYLLRVTLLQENVAWFDDILPSFASVHRVRVKSRLAKGRQRRRRQMTLTRTNVA